VRGDALAFGMAFPLVAHFSGVVVADGHYPLAFAALLGIAAMGWGIVGECDSDGIVVPVGHRGNLGDQCHPLCQALRPPNFIACPSSLVRFFPLLPHRSPLVWSRFFVGSAGCLGDVLGDLGLVGRGRKWLAACGGTAAFLCDVGAIRKTKAGGQVGRRP